MQLKFGDTHEMKGIEVSNIGIDIMDNFHYIFTNLFSGRLAQVVRVLVSHTRNDHFFNYFPNSIK